MKAIFIAAAFLACGLSHPAAAQTTCSEAFAACQRPQQDLRCDVVCKTYCTKQKKACLKTGSFQTRNQHWTALDKK